MKKLLVIIVGIMAIVVAANLMGCNTEARNEDDSKMRIVTEFTDGGTVDENGKKWLRHSFYSDNAELAYSQAQKTAYYYLDHGYEVSELVEEATYSGNRCYSFKTRLS